VLSEVNLATAKSAPPPFPTTNSLLKKDQKGEAALWLWFLIMEAYL